MVFNQFQKKYSFFCQVDIAVDSSKAIDGNIEDDNALTNANDFFLEHNDNYRLSWEVSC